MRWDMLALGLSLFGFGGWLAQGGWQGVRGRPSLLDASFRRRVGPGGVQPTGWRVVYGALAVIGAGFFALSLILILGFFINP